jgi:hypothetical protein
MGGSALSIILNTPPPAVAFSRNPLPIALQSDDYLANSGSAASVIIDFATPIAAGKTLTFSWSAASVAFTFADAPDNSGAQLPSGDGSPAHVATVVTWLNNNFYINRDYTVTQVMIGTDPQPSISITANVFGIVYNLTVTASFGMTFAVTPGVNTLMQSNFRHLLQVWKVGSPDVALYDQNLQLDYPIDGTTTKDLSDVLTTFLDYDIPDLNAVWQPCVLSYMQYYLRYAEIFGELTLAQRAYKTGSYFAYLGGYSNPALGVIADDNHLQNYLMPGGLYQFQRWFESFPVDNFCIRTNTPLFLYFVNNRSIAETLALQVVIAFDTVGPQTIVIAGGLLQPFNKVCVNCSYQALGLTTYTNDTKKVTGYTVTLIETTTGTPRSLTKTFTVDRSYQAYTRYIIYGDSSGNFKTLQMYGKSQLTSNLTDAQAYAFPDQNTPTKGNITRYNIESIESDAVNTGYIVGSNAFDSIKELMLAKKAFRVIGAALVPIVITSEKFDYSSDGVNQSAFKVEYQLAYQNNNYTGSTGALIVPQLNQPQQSLNEI